MDRVGTGKSLGVNKAANEGSRQIVFTVAPKGGVRHFFRAQACHKGLVYVVEKIRTHGNGIPMYPSSSKRGEDHLPEALGWTTRRHLPDLGNREPALGRRRSEHRTLSAA